MQKDLKCPKCSGKMEEGVSVEYKVIGSANFNSNNPKIETWGKKIKNNFFIDSVEKEIPITTYRCSKCGFLESYAFDLSTD